MYIYKVKKIHFRSHKNFIFFSMKHFTKCIHAQQKIKTHENVKNHFVKNHLEYKPLVLKIAN